jgi:glycosyltransferase involved in cell wall biosynthesis
MHPNVLFFIENGWVFGQIHHALIKRLWSKKIYSHLLDWNGTYTYEEFSYFNSKYDTFVTVPCGITALLHYGIPIEKIVAVAHHEKDLISVTQSDGVGMFEALKGYGVIHASMCELSKTLDITRVPSVVSNGVDFDHFYSPISKELKVVGYGSAINSSMPDGTDFKRGYLAPRVLEGLGLDYVTHTFMNHLCMPGYYRTMDALLVTSKYEGCGLPAMEAASAGRLVIGASAGYFTGQSGFLCRTPDDEFVDDAREILLTCKESPGLYKLICEKSQQYARDHYDWEHTVDGWIELFGV